MSLPSQSVRVRFREMGPGDLEEMARLLGDPDVMRFYPAPKSREQAGEWIAWNERNYREYGYGLWVIETLRGEFVGDCGLTWQEVNGSLRLEVGYHVRPSLQGRGFATEAAAACRDFAREVIEARELVAITHPANRASQRVAEKIGMKRIEDDHGPGPLVRTVHGMTF